MNIINEINMGDYRIVVKESDQGHKIARLSSGLHGGILEVERQDDGQIRIKEMEIGSAYITAEHLALLLHYAEVMNDVEKEFQVIKERSEH